MERQPASEPGTKNVIGIINYQMEKSGEFFHKVSHIVLAERPLRLSILISKNNMEKKDGGRHKSICMKCFFIHHAALRKRRKMVVPFVVLD